MDNTIQLYVDKKQEVKGYPITSPDRVIDENGVNIKDYVDEAIDNAKLEGENTQVDLSAYAKKTDLHSHSNKTILDSITTSKITEWDSKSDFSGNYNDLTNKPTIPEPSNYKTAYGTCSTEASVSEKKVVVEDTNWKLEVGNIVAIKHSVSNSASNVKINVNGTGAYPIWYNTTEYTGSSSAYAGYANRTITYMFNGTHWVWIATSYVPSVTNASLGQGYGTCTTAESTLAKACTISSYTLAVGGIVSIKFTNAVPANSTLNIRTRGAKKIFYRGAAITNGIIKAGDIATFIYDGTQYHLISLDNAVGNIPTKTSQLTNDSGFLTSVPSEYITETELNSKGYLTTHQNLSSYAKKSDLPIIVQEIGDSETAVMSQKAVTAFVKETINNYQPPESDGNGGNNSVSGGGENYQYPVAVSVNQMTDTTKSYLSMETGTLWTYSEVEKEIKPYTNLFVKNDCLQYINQRVNSSQTYVEALGFISTPLIDITDIPAGSEIIVRTKGINWDLNAGLGRILCYHDGTNLCTINGGTVVIGGGTPQLCFTYNATSTLDWTFTITAGKLDQPIKKIRFVLPIIPDTNITASDVSDDIIITLNEEIKGGTTTVREYEWVDTSIKPTYDENTVFIDDVSDCTNVNRNYIMESTGTIWSCINTETEVEHNAYDPATTKLNYRINSSLAEASNAGTLLTDYIPLKYKSSGEQITFKGINKLVPNGDIVFTLTYFDSSKKPIKSQNGNPWGYGGTKEYTLPITIDPFLGVSGVENAEYIRVRLSIKPSNTNITASDVAGLVINVKSLNTKQIAKAWVDTNIKPSYAGTIKVVNTVDEMTDTRRHYILKSTGTLWEYTPKKGDMINLYDSTKVQYNKRYSGSPGTIITTNGRILLPEIPIDMSVDEPCLIIKHDGFIGFGNAPCWEKATPLNDGKQALGVLYVNPDQSISNQMKTLKVSEQEFHLYPRFNATGENSYWKDIKYVHLEVCISSVTSTPISSGAEHITGIYNPDYCETVYEWADTGIFIDDGSGGGISGGGISGGSGNYLDLLIKVNKTQKEVDELEERLITVESNIGGEASVPSAWKTAVEECITNIKSHQVGIHCVTFPFFSDHHVRGGYTGLLISKVMKECNIPYCFFGGDSISSGYIEEEETMINQELQFKTIMSYIPDGRFYRAIGNHDGYMIHETTANVQWDRDRIYELFMRDTGIGQLAHFGDDGTYFYVNDIPSKTRFIVLNPNGNYTSEQLNWLQNVAMKFDQPGWGIVFISHQGISAHYHSAIPNVDEVRTILTNYKNSTDANKADLISWHSGHIHRDRIYVGQAINTTDDQVGADLPVKNVTITSDNVAIAYDNATKHANDNSNLSHAIDFVTINRKTRTVKITRLGIGEDREFTF